MLTRLYLLFSIFIYISIVTFVFFLLAWFFTRKFNNKYRNIYALFIDIGKRECLLYATIFLNLLLCLFFLIFSSKYDNFAMYMILFTNFVACLVSFNLRMIISNIIYSFISVELLFLLTSVNNYFNYVSNDNKILILKVLFMCVIFVYTIFITIRKIEICLRANKIRRVINE